MILVEQLAKMNKLVLNTIISLLNYIEPENLEIFDFRPCSHKITLRKRKMIRTITEEVALIRNELSKMGIGDELDKIEIGLHDDDEDVINAVDVLRDVLFELAEILGVYFDDSRSDSE